MKHILIISFWNPTLKEPGKGIFIHEQINAVCKNRNDVVFLEVNVISSNKALFSINLEENPLYLSKKISITIKSLWWKFIYLNPWLIYFILRKILYKKYAWLTFEIIHSNVIFPCAIVGHFLSKKYNSKHIISEHWSKAEKILKHPIYGSIALKTYRDSKAILCVSNFLATKIKSATGNTNIKIVPNIIDTKLFRYIPKHLENPGELYFTCVAKWEKPKRLDLIINSLLTFACETNKSLNLNVVGDGVQKEDFVWVKYPNNLKINWLGHINKTQIATILGQTDVFMHASEIETFSIVTVEALSTGTPVLASNVGALPEIINSNNGILVENTLDAWFKGLHEIIVQKFDNKVIATENRDKFSPDSVAKSIGEIYNINL